MSPILAQTPHTTKELIEQGEKLHKTINELQLDNKNLESQMNRFIKGSIASAYGVELSERDLLAIRKEINAKAARKKLGGNVAQKGVF